MASLGELVAGVAHEINNPLAFVISHLTTVMEGLAGILPEVEPHLSDKSHIRLNKLQQRLQDMQTGLERIKDLVIKLRTFSRLDEGEFKQVNIEECIESVLTLLQYRLKDRISVVRKYGDDNIIRCYPGPLNQVIMNVISNAIDAVEGQGVITITTSKTDSNYTISIADTGIGIPDDIRDRVFEPFFTTKPVGQGTGLGLSISYGIVKKHGGEIGIKSEPGKGTKMIITIPWKQ
jgi:two-component system NtrC family sensor kinase